MNTTLDEITEEVRRARGEIAEECGFDMRQIAVRAQALAERLRAEGWEFYPPPPPRSKPVQPQPDDAAVS